MSDKKEEQTIEEYWNLFRDTLPGAESAVEAIYRMTEVLSRQVDEYSDPKDREDRYPILTITRNRRNPPTWNLTLKFWSHISDEIKALTSQDRTYSKAVSDIFEQVRKSLKEEIALRLSWVKQTERELADNKDNHRKAERFLSSLGTYTPEQQNLPLGIEGNKEAT